MSDLKQALRAYNGKAVSILSEARVRFGEGDDVLLELAPLIASQDGYISDGATWLLKAYAEDGVAIAPNARAAILKNLGGVASWQAALHLCQTAKFLGFTPAQARAFADWAAAFIDHDRPFLRAWSIDALQHMAALSPNIAPLAEKALKQARDDKAASVRARARKYEALKP
ncbi:MAG: hypothetical protein AAGH48_07170 [Pseudomonadota bacterium]